MNPAFQRPASHAEDCECRICLMTEEIGQLQCAVNLFRHCLEDEKRKHAETREKLKAAVGLR